MPLKVNQMGDILLDTVEELTAMDVYDLAADIGKECEKLIHTVGTESMSDLIKKVIVVLEILEAFTTKNERTEQEFLELTKKINQLEAEKQTKAENRRKFEKVKDYSMGICDFSVSISLFSGSRNRWRGAGAAGEPIASGKQAAIGPGEQ